VSNLTPNSTTNKADSGIRVAFDLSPEVSSEIDRIMKLTDISSRAEVFRRAFTLLRIHIDAATKGREILMVDPNRPDEKYFLVLPFHVRRE
jgi:hypothetical protein